MKYMGKNVVVKFILICFLCVFSGTIIGCGESGSAGDDSGGGGGDDPIAAISSIGLLSTQDSILPGGETTITAIAYDETGHVMANHKIDFKLDDPTLGSITASGTTQSDGTFAARFIARGLTGQVNITAFSESVTSQPKIITIKNQSASIEIALAANPTVITATNSSSITATVTNPDGSPIENGTTVTFSVENSAFGTISESATTNAGKASATFIANNFAGTATIKAKAGSSTASVDVLIKPVDAASIEFDSVSHNPIAIRGTGGQEWAEIRFNVKDINGNPAEDIDVVFTMDSGVQGSEYLEENDTSPYSHTVGTSSGVASITLHSGYEAGIVSITATIVTPNGDTISATTPVISIGGGVPTDDWFTVSVAEPGWNLGGLECVGIEARITAWLADRFGNYNVLDGHNVFFETEVGLAAYPVAVTDGAKGTATSVVRTQGATGRPKNVVPETWEENLKADLAAVYNLLLPGHPRDGSCSILIFTRGEESFIDGSKGQPVNGQYDLFEDYVDTVDDPWRDYDDDGLRDNGTETTPLTTAVGETNPEEEYLDRNGNDGWNGPNTEWDGDKNLFRQVNFLITGLPNVAFSKGSFNVPNGGSDTVGILICDENYNPLSAGSSYSVSVDVGKITGGTKSYDYPSSSFFGGQTRTDINLDGMVDELDFRAAHRDLVENVITISDGDTSDTDPPELAELSITVTWKSNGACGERVDTFSITGFVD